MHARHIKHTKKKEQSSYKPGSVPAGSNRSHAGKCLSFIYHAGHPTRLPLRCSVLPSASDEQPSDGSLHKLAAPKTHLPRCHHRAGELLPHLLTLTGKPAVVFFCVTQPSLTACTFASGTLCAARTFLLRLLPPATSRNSVLVCISSGNLQCHVSRRMAYFLASVMSPSMYRRTTSGTPLVRTVIVFLKW